MIADVIADGQVARAVGREVDWELISTRKHLASLRPELEQLWERTGAPPSARWETIQPWLQHNPRFEPWGVLVRSKGEIVSVALLAHADRRGIHEFATLGHVGAPNCLPATSPAAARWLARSLRCALESIGRPWILQLSGLAAEDPAVDALRAELSVSATELGPPVARLCFSRDQPLSRYVSRNTRSAVAKALNRIKLAGLQHKLEWTRDPTEIDQITDEIVDVHRRRSHQMYGESSLDDSTNMALFVDIVHAHAHANRIRLLTLRINGALAAFALCEDAAGTLWVDTNRASPDWLAFSPGTIVNAEIVRAAHADPAIHAVDWGGELQRYKLSGDVTLVRFQSLWAWSSHPVRAFVRCERCARRLLKAFKAFLDDGQRGRSRRPDA